MRIDLTELGKKSSIKFGTSGIRGLAESLTDFICYSYTIGFLKYLESIHEIENNNSPIAIGGDFRPSTDRIMRAIAKAILDMGYSPLNCGKVPTPALAYYSFQKNVPSIMVTGSHIPDDRNGIKFYKNAAEVLKTDEKCIVEQIVDIPNDIFETNGNLKNSDYFNGGQSIQEEVEEFYTKRYLDFFPRNALSGKRIGLYEHSSVGRNVIYRILTELGAVVVKLGYSDKFIPVDTEAVREEDIAAAKRWISEYNFDAIVSTDGDGDRPLISDEKGNWLRGDISGILCAKYLEADSVSTSITCNSAVEKCGWFKNVIRTKIGSPYVIESMNDQLSKGYKTVVSYEANGGFLTGSMILKNNKALNSLPTRDAIISHLSILSLSIEQNKPISELVKDLPQRFTASGRITGSQVEKSKELLKQFSTPNEEMNEKAILNFFGNEFGKITKIDRTDGIRIFFENDEIIHLRASGNAPEFRCYTESKSENEAKALIELCLFILKRK